MWEGEGAAWRQLEKTHGWNGPRHTQQRYCTHGRCTVTYFVSGGSCGGRTHVCSSVGTHGVLNELITQSSGVGT